MEYYQTRKDICTRSSGESRCSELRLLDSDGAEQCSVDDEDWSSDDSDGDKVLYAVFSVGRDSPCLDLKANAGLEGANNPREAPLRGARRMLLQTPVTLQKRNGESETVELVLFEGDDPVVTHLLSCHEHYVMK